MAILKLYRGDSSKIRKFEFSRTNDWCYRGQGIYLTDSLSVAETYRDKGHSGIGADPDIQLVSKKYATKSEALEAALQAWLGIVRASENGSAYANLSDPKRREYRAIKLGIWDDLVAAGRITIKIHCYASHPSVVNKHYEIKCLSKNPIGRITSFNFDRDAFESGLVKTDEKFYKWDKDYVFLEYLYSLGLFMLYRYGEQLTLEKYCAMYRYSSLSELVSFRSGAMCGSSVRKYIAVRTKKTIKTNTIMIGGESVEIRNLPNWNGMIDAFSKIGYHGYEYDGGMHTGSERHRAFVVWDEEYTNSSKFGVIR